MDTKKPCVKDLTIDEIREEMLLSKTAFERRKKSTVTIYTEDDEGLTVLRRIIRKTDLAEHEKTKGFSIRKVAISIGCNQMIKWRRIRICGTSVVILFVYLMLMWKVKVSKH